MIESLNTIRSLGIGPVFESIYFGRDVPEVISPYFGYPDLFRKTALIDCGPLTEGRLIPICDDGNGDNICLFDPVKREFVVKFMEEPEEVVREFSLWQQYLAHVLLAIADSGATDDEIVEVADLIGFKQTEGLLALLSELELLPDDIADRRTEDFIVSCG